MICAYLKSYWTYNIISSTLENNQADHLNYKRVYQSLYVYVKL